MTPPHKKNTCKVGIDITEIKRFKDALNKEQHSFFNKVFLKKEREYCDAYKDRAVHYAGIFAAKEAVSKALGVTKYPFSQVEIRHTKDGAPVAYFQDKKLHISISISHTRTTTVAVAIE
jgi:holo-[acyl-carrier protein] synthase